MEPRFTFDRVAALYDEVRAGYPDAVFRALAALAPEEGALLEVGCGTGKATVGFAALGLHIVALDPGPAMIAEAKANLDGYARVRFVQSTFEDWRPDAGRFDMVASAQAWHWVPPEIGLPKAAALLAPDGVLALFGNDWEPRDPGLREAIDSVYVRLAPELRNSPLGTWYRPGSPLTATIAASEDFDDPQYRKFAWSRDLALEAYLVMLCTLSNHQSLEPGRLQALIGAIEEAAHPFGPIVELSYLTHLHHCRRL